MNNCDMFTNTSQFSRDHYKVDFRTVTRGTHVYVWRAVLFYQHHGIVIAQSDLESIARDFWPRPLHHPIVIIEQNRPGGLRIVNHEDFQQNSSQVYRAQYSAPPWLYHIKRSGTRYTRTCLPPETVVANAIHIFNTEKELWRSYHLLKRNCEHFAFFCCTQIDFVSEQVSTFVDGAFAFVKVGLYTLCEKVYNALCCKSID
jgi:hypothetical protein